MKRIFILLSLCLIGIGSFAQKPIPYSENDVKQFYRTIQGDYTGNLNDSTSASIHFTPIWEREDDRFHWLYMEAVNTTTKEVLAQNVIEIKPISDISFRVIVHGLNNPQMFEGKWSNRNFFDGYTTSILKGKAKYLFMKTKDFEYQTSWYKRKLFKCFPSGEKLHFKFVQEDERFYIKRLEKGTSHLIGYTFFKAPTD